MKESFHLMETFLFLEAERAIFLVVSNIFM